tara:strand:+ start:1095 stop:2852 length:1758 start_codon:yes stop_codon:yes gene_type:complete
MRIRKLSLLILTVVFVGTMLSCEEDSRYADLILLNGNVYTFSWPDPDRDGNPARSAPVENGRWYADAEAVAIKDGDILSIGSADQMKIFTGLNTRLIDLQGATLLPGLVDSHTHVAGLGARLTRVDLFGVETEEEAIRLVAERAAETPAGEWIIGWGWNEGAWASNYPTLERLSKAIPNHPVILKSLHGFAIWGNQLAFEKSGITSETEPPVGGIILKDEQGNPSGVVLNRATTLLNDAIPSPTIRQTRDLLKAGLQEMARSGFVMVHEAGCGTNQMTAMEAMERDGDLSVRVYAMLSARDEALMRHWIDQGPDKDLDGMLMTRSVKGYYDGALGSRGARLLEDYSDKPGHKGVSGEGYGFDESIVEKAMKVGFQVGIHAIGDAGNRETLDFFQSVFSESPKTRRGRHRIEHAQIIHPDDFERFVDMDIIASMQPPHAVEDKLWAEERLGPDRVKGGYAWRKLRKMGVKLVFDSDLAGSDHDIFYGLHAAMTRRDKFIQPPEGWYPDQKMSPEEALRGYTVWAAYAGFLEKQTGTIEKGKWADITVMNIDPLNIGETEPEELFQGEILLTIVRGNVVFEKAGQFR